MNVSFTKINQYTKERLIHPSRYSENQFSYLKIYQHALKFAMDGQHFKIIRNYFFLPFWLQMMTINLKRLVAYKKTLSPRLKEYVLLDNGRMVLDEAGKWHSIYFDKITDLIGREKVSILCDSKNMDSDYDYRYVPWSYRMSKLDETEIKILKEINLSLRKAKKSKQYTKIELRHLYTEMHLFFESFSQNYNFLKGQKIKHFILICHYQREGLIAALKLLNIPHSEIQHGLIANSDNFYVYDEQYSQTMSKAMMPDRIITYGPYWKRVLEQGCEFRSRDIFVGGDYLFRLNNKELDGIQKENIVLICTQTGAFKSYSDYTKNLLTVMEKYPDWRIIIKMHPGQRDKKYFDNFKEFGVEIVDRQIPLDVLLAKSKIQITIYSTTLYDALGFDTLNFSLQDFSVLSDYAADMITERVAYPLYVTEDPIEKYFQIKSGQLESQELLSREDVYAPYNPEVFKEILGL